MFRNFLKIAIRSLTKHKGHALLNIFGLTVGITCCLLIFSYVAYERSYDRFNDKADRIFRVQDEEYQGGRLVVPCAAAMPGVAPAMKREFPEVEQAGRLRKIQLLLGNETRNIRFKEPTVYYADGSMLDILHISLVAGNAKTALSGPGKIIISEDESRKYFGTQNPLGKTLSVYSSGKIRPLEVTGVFQNYPSNSHLKLSILVSYLTYSQVIGSYGNPNDVLETSFGWTDFYTYILLRKGADPKRVQAKLPGFIDRHYNDLPENKAEGDRYSLSLMPLKDIHLYSHYTEEAEANGDGQSVTFLFLIAFFIICIAWINYINLATARSLERAREVGVRKVLGALRGELIGQFMLESLLLNLIALLAAVMITLALTPLFANLSGRSLPFLLSLPTVYKGYFIILLITGIFLSGIYPALVLSRYMPVTVLKGAFKNAAGGKWLRNGLIVGQFAASIILIAGTLIVYRQMHYMRNQDLGANISETMIIRGAFGGLTDSSYQDIYHSFKDDILRVPGVKSITSSSGIIGEEILWSTNWNKVRGGSKQSVILFHLSVDEDFIAGYGLKMLAGKPFSKAPNENIKKIILNETAVHTLGYPTPQSAIGELISGGQDGMDSMQVTGVTADFHNEGLQKAIQPLVIFSNLRSKGNYSVKIEGRNVTSAISSIKKVWDRHFASNPYDYFFLDEFFNRQYDENRRFGMVFGLFAILAIMISCFGLLGLSAYNVLQRTREIGIRKVLGASINSLLFTLSRDFIVLVIVAFVIAVPAIAVAMNSWLQSFAYRININWWIYAVAGSLAILIALATVGFQSFRAATANPVTSLRSE